MNRFSRLTTGQAVVRFLAHQFAERDGRENRFIEGIWAIFGHGNVAGLGQGIVEYSQAEGLKFFRPQHEQAMVHTAAAFAKHRNRLATFACTTSIGPGAANMITGAAGATVNRLPVLLGGTSQWRKSAGRKEPAKRGRVTKRRPKINDLYSHEASDRTC